MIDYQSDDYRGRRVLVAGARIAGAASAEVLLGLDAQVTVLDQQDSPALQRLREAGATVILGNDPPAGLFDALDDVVVSPGFAPHTPVARAAAAAGVPVYCEPELAWRLRGPDAPAWLGVTGTNGKTTTTTMLAAILTAAGRRTAALGNVGEPLVYAALDGSRFDVLAVELSSFQLYWSSTLAPEAGAILNLAEDHLEWHGTYEEYGRAKTAIWRSAPTGGLAIGNVDDPWVAKELAAVPGRHVTVSFHGPGRDAFWCADGHLVGDLGGVTEVIIAEDAIRPAGRHNVANALAAAALARSYGVSTDAIRAGLEGYVPEPHRNAYVSTVDGVAYVNDSKATNPHAALASLLAYPSIVWIAGGQLKGVSVDDLVATVADRLAGVVLLGVDRAEIADALRRHAPAVLVIEVDRTDAGAMGVAVGAASVIAEPGDTVLLAPAAASKDMFSGYPERGDAFAAAVAGLT